MSRKLLAGAVAVLTVAILAAAMMAQGARISSPDGIASTEIRGKYAGGPDSAYQGGKWIEVTSGRPIKRGRELWGFGLDLRPASQLGCASLARRRQRVDAPQNRTATRDGRQACSCG